MKLYLKEYPDAIAFRKCFTIWLSLCLVFAACSAKRATPSSEVREASSPEQAKGDLAASQQWTKSDGAITGALTINGKPTILKYAYARRHIITRSASEKFAVIEILLADKEVPDEALTAMFADNSDRVVGHGNPFTEDKNLLSLTSTSALLFTIHKSQINTSPTGYFESVVTRDGLLYPISIASTDFEEFDLKQGVVTATAKNEIDESVSVPDDAGYSTRKATLKYSYRVSFQARFAKAGTSAPADTKVLSEGTATGEINLEGQAGALKYAYARGERVFFDEPEKIVHVLITDVPIPAEHLEAAFNDGFLPDDLKVKGIHLKTDADGKLIKYSVREWGNPVAISIVRGADELAVKEVAATGDRVKGKVSSKNEANKQSFSVTFDAPL
jgi:hypothetical protein